MCVVAVDTCSLTPTGLLAPDQVRSSSMARLGKAKATYELSISELNSMSFII